MYKINIVRLMVFLSMVLSACSSDSGAPSSNPETSTTSNQQTSTTELQQAELDDTLDRPQNPSWASYQDSRVQLRYPPELILEQPTLSAVTAAFISAEPNELGQFPSCVYGSEFAVGSSLVEVLDEALPELYVDSPEPDIQFLEVNGVSAARISGIVKAIPIMGTSQIIYAQNTFFLLHCLAFPDDIVESIFDSFTVLN